MTMHGRFRATLLAAAASLALGAGIAHADVTYEEVLANPGDLQLSYTYAREQIRAGKLEQAAGALERLLLLEPNWDSARLLYAIVLYRLDDLEGAKRELALLQGRPLSDRQAGQVDRYLEKAEQKSQSVRWSGAVSVGLGVDSNPSFASSADPVTYGGFSDFSPYYAYATLGDSDEETDGMFAVDARLRVEADLNTGRGDYVYTQGRARLNEQFDQSDVDYVRGDIDLGAKFFFGDLAVNPELSYSAIGVGDDFLRHEYGGRLGLEYVITPGFALLAGGNGAWLDYDEDDDEVEGRDGWRAWGGGGFRARLGDNNTFQAEARYHHRDSENDAFSYRGYEIALRDRHLLGMGQYILAEFNYWHLDYEEGLLIYENPSLPDLDIVLPEREDDRFKARLAYGLPLSTLLSAVGAERSTALDSFNLQASVGYFWQNSNIPIYDTENWSGELLLTKRFGL